MRRCFVKSRNTLQCSAGVSRKYAYLKVKDKMVRAQVKGKGDRLYVVPGYYFIFLQIKSKKGKGFLQFFKSKSSYLTILSSQEYLKYLIFQCKVIFPFTKEKRIQSICQIFMHLQDKLLIVQMVHLEAQIVVVKYKYHLLKKT